MKTCKAHRSLHI